MFCTNCGQKVPDNALFCVNCGSTLNTAPIAPEAPVAPVAPTVPEAPVAPVAPVVPEAPVAPVAPVVPEAPVAPVAPIVPEAPTMPLEPAAPGITGPLTPDMFVPPYGAAPAAVSPYDAPLPPFSALLDTSAPQPQPSPQKQKRRGVLMALLAILAVLAIVAGAFWAIGGFDALLGNTGVSDKDDTDSGKTTTAPTEGSTTAPTEGSTTAPTQGSTTAPTQGSTTAPTQGSTTAPTQGSTTAPTQGSTTAPTTAAGSNSLTGALRGGVYYNERFNLQFNLGSGWKNGDALDYSAVETAGISCGLAVRKTGDHVAEKLSIYFMSATLSADNYATLLGSLAQLDYASMGFGSTVTADSAVDVAGKMWQSVTVTVEGGMLYQRYLVTEENGYLIVVDITSPYAAHLNSLLCNLSTIR